MDKFDRALECKYGEYLSYLSALANTKYADCDDADELIQKTLIAFLIKQRKGEEIDSPKAFLATVLKNKHADLLRKKYKQKIVEYNDSMLQSVAPDEADTVELEERAGEYESVRREIGRLLRMYREITVRHYVHGQCVERIAKDMGLPRGTVLSRLSAAREQIKEGLCKMEKYAPISYEPKHIKLGIWGHCGNQNEPFSLLSSQIESNAMILAYENPVSVRGIADSIGMPSAYLEPIIEKLVEGELMGRTAGGLVYTRCFLQPFENNLGNIDAQKKIAAQHAARIREVALKHLSPLLARPECTAMSDKQRASLVLLTITRALLELIRACKPTYEGAPESPPTRPNGGRWLATGIVFEHAQKQEHPYFCSGPVEVGYRSRSSGPWECKMYDFQSCIGDGYGSYQSLKYKTSLTSILRLYASLLPTGIECESNSMLELIPEFEERAIMKRGEDGEIRLDIPALTYEEYQTYWGPAKAAIREELESHLADDIRALWCNCSNRVPKHVDEAAHFRHTGALGAYVPLQLLAIIEQELLPWQIVVGKTPLILVLYRKKGD